MTGRELWRIQYERHLANPAKYPHPNATHRVEPVTASERIRAAREALHSTETAYRTVLVYRQYAGKDDQDMGDSIVDLTVELFHLGNEYGLDLEDILRMALRNYKAEISEMVEAF